MVGFAYRLGTVLISVLPMALLMACDDPQATRRNGKDTAFPDREATQPGSTGWPQIALVMKTLTNPFFIDMEKGARRAEREFEVTLLVRTVAEETSVEQQIGIVEDLADDGIDAIVIAPADSVRLIPPLKKAQDVGILIVNIDNRLDPTYTQKLSLTGVPFISVNNEQSAYLSARTLVETVTDATEAAILEGIPTAANAQERRRGAERAFAENEYVTLVASRPAYWKIDDAYRVTGLLLNEFPNLRLIFAANDMMALGARQRVVEGGRTDVRVAGYDALNEAVEAVKTGALVATVDQNAAEQGYLGVAYAVKMMRGEAVPAETFLDVTLITANHAR